MSQTQHSFIELDSVLPLPASLGQSLHIMVKEVGVWERQIDGCGQTFYKEVTLSSAGNPHALLVVVVMSVLPHITTIHSSSVEYRGRQVGIHEWGPTLAT